MNNEQKLEAVINQYRQWLADEQLKTAGLNADLRSAQERIESLQSELDGYVQQED